MQIPSNIQMLTKQNKTKFNNNYAIPTNIPPQTQSNTPSIYKFPTSQSYSETKAQKYQEDVERQKITKYNADGGFGRNQRFGKVDEGEGNQQDQNTLANLLMYQSGQIESRDHISQNKIGSLQYWQSNSQAGSLDNSSSNPIRHVHSRYEPYQTPQDPTTPKCYPTSDTIPQIILPGSTTLPLYQSQYQQISVQSSKNIKQLQYLKQNQQRDKKSLQFSQSSGKYSYNSLKNMKGEDIVEKEVKGKVVENQDDDDDDDEEISEITQDLCFNFIVKLVSVFGRKINMQYRFAFQAIYFTDKYQPYNSNSKQTNTPSNQPLKFSIAKDMHPDPNQPQPGINSISSIDIEGNHSMSLTYPYNISTSMSQTPIQIPKRKHLFTIEDPKSVYSGTYSSYSGSCQHQIKTNWATPLPTFNKIIQEQQQQSNTNTNSNIIPGTSTGFGGGEFQFKNNLKMKKRKQNTNHQLELEMRDDKFDIKYDYQVGEYGEGKGKERVVQDVYSGKFFSGDEGKFGFSAQVYDYRAGSNDGKNKKTNNFYKQNQNNISNNQQIQTKHIQNKIQIRQKQKQMQIGYSQQYKQNELYPYNYEQLANSNSQQYKLQQKQKQQRYDSYKQLQQFSRQKNIQNLQSMYLNLGKEIKVCKKIQIGKILGFKQVSMKLDSIINLGCNFQTNLNEQNSMPENYGKQSGTMLKPLLVDQALQILQNNRQNCYMFEATQINNNNNTNNNTTHMDTINEGQQGQNDDSYGYCVNSSVDADDQQNEDPIPLIQSSQKQKKQVSQSSNQFKSNQNDQPKDSNKKQQLKSSLHRPTPYPPQPIQLHQMQQLQQVQQLNQRQQSQQYQQYHEYQQQQYQQYQRNERIQQNGHQIPSQVQVQQNPQSNSINQNQHLLIKNPYSEPQQQGNFVTSIIKMQENYTSGNNNTNNNSPQSSSNTLSSNGQIYQPYVQSHQNHTDEEPVYIDVGQPIFVQKLITINKQTQRPTSNERPTSTLISYHNSNNSISSSQRPVSFNQQQSPVYSHPNQVQIVSNKDPVARNIQQSPRVQPVVNQKSPQTKIRFSTSQSPVTIKSPLIKIPPANYSQSPRVNPIVIPPPPISRNLSPTPIQAPKIGIQNSPMKIFVDKRDVSPSNNRKVFITYNNPNSDQTKRPVSQPPTLARPVSMEPRYMSKPMDILVNSPTNAQNQKIALVRADYFGQGKVLANANNFVQVKPMIQNQFRNDPRICFTGATSPKRQGNYVSIQQQFARQGIPVYNSHVVDVKPRPVSSIPTFHTTPSTPINNLKAEQTKVGKNDGELGEAAKTNERKSKLDTTIISQLQNQKMPVNQQANRKEVVKQNYLQQTPISESKYIAKQQKKQLPSNQYQLQSAYPNPQKQQLRSQQNQQNQQQTKQFQTIQHQSSLAQLSNQSRSPVQSPPHFNFTRVPSSPQLYNSPYTSPYFENEQPLKVIKQESSIIESGGQSRFSGQSGQGFSQSNQGFGQNTNNGNIHPMYQEYRDHDNRPGSRGKKIMVFSKQVAGVTSSKQGIS